MRKVLSVAVCIILLAACRDNIDPLFLESDVPSLTMGGRTIMQYDPDFCQMGYSPSRHEFRVHTDNMSDYFVVKLDRDPSSEGETLKGELRWTSNSSEKKMTGVQFTVEKIGSDGLVWLWNSSDKTGVLVRKL